MEEVAIEMRGQYYPFHRERVDRFPYPTAIVLARGLCAKEKARVRVVKLAERQPDVVATLTWERGRVVER